MKFYFEGTLAEHSLPEGMELADVPSVAPRFVLFLNL